jgi:hypothetical protein
MIYPANVVKKIYNQTNKSDNFLKHNLLTKLRSPLLKNS